MTAEPTLAQTAQLLGAVFPGAPRVGEEAYLHWLYEESPHGRVIQTNRLDDLGLSAHYAVVPVALARDGAVVSGALSLNTAVHERARGGGTFVSLATETYAAAAELGVRIVVGVANANSTPGFLRRLAFSNEGALPVSVLLPAPGRRGGFQSAWAPTAGQLLAGAEPLLTPPARGLTRAWTPETLAWRLASPGARYAIHRSGDALVISTKERRAGFNVALVLAVFAAAPLPRGRTRAITRAVCGFHRAPVALHAGFNDRARFHGIPLPDRLRPSPLNLIARALDGSQVPAPSRFEFLDFDAY